MTVLSTLTIKLLANTGEFTKQMTAAQKATEKNAQQMISAGSKLSVGVTLPLAALGVAATNAASDLDESMSKANVVFGDSIKKVDEFASTSAEAFGVSKRAAYEATGTFGNLFTTMGIAQGAAADMSIDVVKLASDLASFNNLGTDEALDKLRAGLVGEAEPLRALGVNINAAALESKALEMGLVGANGELSEGAKVQARYQLILEQTTTAQGDFARTSDGLANSQRAAQAAFENAASSLGTSLLPIAAKATQTVANLATQFSKLSPEVQETIVLFGGVAAGIGPVMVGIGKATQMYNQLTVALNAANISMGRFLITAGAVTAAVVLAGKAIADYKALQNDIAEGVEQVNNKWQDFFNKQIEGGANAAEVLEAYRAKQAEVNAVMEEGGIIADLLMRGHEDLTGSTSDLFTAMAAASTTGSEYIAAIDIAIASTDGLTFADKLAAVAIYEKIAAEDEAKESILAVSDAAEGLDNSTVSLTAATINQEQAWYNYQTASLAAYESTVAASEAAGEAKRKQEELALMSLALSDGLKGELTGAYQDYTAAVDEGNISQEAAAQKLEEATKQLIYQKIAAELDAEAALNLARQWDLVSESDYNLAVAMETLTERFDANHDGVISASEAANGFYTAMESLNKKASDGVFTLEDLNAMLDELDGKSVTATVNINTRGSVPNLGGVSPYTPGTSTNPGIIPQASGGDWMVTKPTLFLAGDNGPERATFSPAGAGGAGGDRKTVINLEPHYYRGDEMTLTQELAAIQSLFEVG